MLRGYLAASRIAGVTPARRAQSRHRWAFDGKHDALLQSFDGGAEMPRLFPFARDHGVTRFLESAT
jgi:hypothetical protein